MVLVVAGCVGPVSGDREAFIRSEHPCDILTAEHAQTMLGGPVRAIRGSALPPVVVRLQAEAESDRPQRTLDGSHCVYRRDDGDAHVMFRIHLQRYDSEEAFMADWAGAGSKALGEVGRAAVYRSNPGAPDQQLVTAMINTTQGIFTVGIYDAEDVSKDALVRFSADLATRYVGGCPPRC
jgi:hypothetical protein